MIHQKRKEYGKLKSSDESIKEFAIKRSINETDLKWVGWRNEEKGGYLMLTAQYYPMKRSFFKLLVFILLLTTSCIREEIIEESMNDYLPKLVVYSVLTPGDSIFVHITKSLSISSNESYYLDSTILDASVSIENQYGEVIYLNRLPTNTSLFCASQASFPIIGGLKYNLFVEVAGFSSVFASTRIPNNAYSWSNVIDQKILIPEDYYNIQGIEVFAYWSQPDTAKYGNKVVVNEINEIIDSAGNYLRAYKTTQDYSSITTIGTEHVFYSQYPLERYDDISIDCSFPFHNCVVDSGTIISRLQQLELYLITTDLNLTLFNQAVEIYSDIWFFSDSFLDQFQGIIPEYTNIENGLGIFGSCLQTKQTIYINHEK